MPRDALLKLHVASADLKIVDSAGAAVAATGDQQSFRHDSADSNPKSFKYTIASVVP